jgi:hypothetical protein
LIDYFADVHYLSTKNKKKVAFFQTSDIVVITPIGPFALSKPKHNTMKNVAILTAHLKDT